MSIPPVTMTLFPLSLLGSGGIVQSTGPVYWYGGRLGILLIDIAVVSKQCNSGEEVVSCDL